MTLLIIVTLLIAKEPEIIYPGLLGYLIFGMRMQNKRAGGGLSGVGII